MPLDRLIYKLLIYKYEILRLALCSEGQNACPQKSQV
jgi:hypothetical protein